MKLKSKILLIVLLHFYRIDFAQISNFKSYQENINKAELNLVRGNKIEALNIYFKTLINSDGNFSKDIYNSLILSKELNRLDTFYTLLNLVKFKNFSNDYLDSLPEFKSLHNNKKWIAFLNSNKLKTYIDTTLKKQMDSLFVTDQYFRLKENSYEVYGDTIKKIDSSNVNFLMNLIYSKGLPGEKEIGADDFYSSEGYDIVLHHWSQNRSKNSKIVSLTPFLIIQAQEGRIEPNKCSHYLEMQNEGFDGGVFSITRAEFNDSITSYYRPNYSNLRKMEINLYRRLLFLEPLDDYYEKVRYKITHPDSKYKFDIRLNTFHISTQQEFNMYLKYEAGIELK